jgi:uncharacterized protein (DUF1778 family)
MKRMKTMMKMIKEDQTLKLSVEESEALVEALLKPPDPNNALKTAFSTYEQVISIDAM